MWGWILKYWLEVGFGLITTLVTYLFTKIRTVKKNTKEDNQLIKEALKSILHNILIVEGQKMLDKGYCMREDYERISEYYLPYKALGGNGSAKRMVEQIENLPSVPPQHIETGEHHE